VVFDKVEVYGSLGARLATPGDLTIAVVSTNSTTVDDTCRT
jgi:hypothetical protein